MRDDQDVDLLRRFLVGEVEPEERTRVEERFMADPEYFEMLCALEDEMELSYVRGTLSERWRASFSAHVLTSPVRRRHVEQAAALAEALTSATSRVVQPRTESTPGPRWVRRSLRAGLTFPLRVRVLAGAGALAAAAALLFLAVLGAPDGPATIEPAVSRTPTRADAPPSDGTGGANAARPMVLAARLLGSSDLQRRSEFRFTAPEDRLPKRNGSIVAFEAGTATIDVGSLDGLSNGSVLSVVRGPSASPPVGSLIVTTVFRERARGQSVDERPLQPGDRVEADSADYLLALEEQIAARAARGDMQTANALAELALPIAQSSEVRADARRTALARLGALAYRRGDFDTADRHLRAAADAFDASPAAPAAERAEILNELGAVALARGDLSDAEDVLLRAQTLASGGTVLTAHVANNLAAIAALRGDRPRAESLYESALAVLATHLAAGDEDRVTVEKNLASVRGSR